jgi:hypothetical protein
MIQKIENETCYAIWDEGFTQSWSEVAALIQAAWNLTPFLWLDVLGVKVYVGEQHHLAAFLQVLAKEWEPTGGEDD